MNADVTPEKVYNNMGHTISEDEIREVNRLIFHQADVVKSQTGRLCDLGIL